MADFNVLLKRINIAVFAISIVTVVIILIGFGARDTTSHSTSGSHSVAVLSSADAKKEVNLLARQYWEWQMENYPETATYMGSRVGLSKLTNLTIDAIRERAEAEREFLARANTTSLLNANFEDEEDLITLKMLISELRNSIEAFEYESYYFVMNQLEGPQLDLVEIFTQYMPLEKTEDFEYYVGRLSAIKEFLRQTESLLIAAVTNKRTYPKVVLNSVASQIDKFCTLSGQSPFLSVFERKFGASVDGARVAKLRELASTIIERDVTPAFCSLKNVWLNVYFPNCTLDIGATERVGGDFYAFKIFESVTLPVSAQLIHSLGLSEVTRIRKEMDEIKIKISKNSSILFTDFNNLLRNDPANYFSNEEAYLTMTRDICKRADGALPQLFRVLPRCPYGVSPMDAAKAPTAPAAYYMEPDEGCTRAGEYMVNTYDLGSRPKYLMESTALHETVPGHHLQIAIAAELEDLPLFRRFASVTSFIEGWALYAESLGETMGFYSDEKSLYGHLSDEMLRAMRLVVDTGMHSMKWTRARAIQFMLDNSPLSLQDITSEVDRYIVWPAQALSYKSGQLTISHLKQSAQLKLGSDFSIRNFHHAVLRHGAIPLRILAEVVQKEIGFTTNTILPLV